MGSIKNQMISERDDFYVALYNTAKNSDNLEEFFSLANELFFICKRSGALYEEALVFNSVPLSDQELWEDLLTDHWDLYIEEQSQKHNNIYEMEN
tara:strand:- start:229 stop:513 length:285 start_codon:yes stop_codon:yes gene_type:complete